MQKHLWYIAWEAEFVELVNSETHYRQALRSLKSGGCDTTEVIIPLLAACTHHTAEENAISQQIRSAVMAKRERLLKPLKRINASLSRANNELKQLLADPLSQSLLPFFNNELFWVQLPAYLEGATNWLNDKTIGLSRLRKMLGERGLPKDLLIILLCVYVHRVIGRPCYREISDLLDAAYRAQGTKPDISAELVRKKVDRFQVKHDPLFALLYFVSLQYEPKRSSGH